MVVRPFRRIPCEGRPENVIAGGAVAMLAVIEHRHIAVPVEIRTVGVDVEVAWRRLVVPRVACKLIAG